MKIYRNIYKINFLESNKCIKIQFKYWVRDKPKDGDLVSCLVEKEGLKKFSIRIFMSGLILIVGKVLLFNNGFLIRLWIYIEVKKFLLSAIVVNLLIFLKLTFQI